MATNHETSEGAHFAGSGKKAYQKPGFRFEKVFVTSALTCSKSGTEGSCNLNPPIKLS